MSDPVSVDVEEINQATSLIIGALERVEKEQGAHDAVRAAIKNLYGNAAFLAARLEAAELFRVFADVQGDLIEGILEQSAATKH